MIKVSAPGKLMLFGEHAVVYGHPCIVSAVDQRLCLEIEETTHAKIEIIAPQAKNTKFIDSAIGIFTDKFQTTPKHIQIVTNCNFSGKYGFGSSAAVTVATLFALSKYYGQNLSKKELFDLAYQCILQVQGVGSGFDVAAAVFGGNLFFTKAGKVLEQLNGKNLYHLPLVVGYSGIKSNTVDIVKQVAIKKDKHPQQINRIFDQIDKLVIQAKKAVLNEDWPTLGKLMNENQQLLAQLGVSCDVLDRLIKAADTAGAWGAKLSGAGGGDCMIALVSQDKRKQVERAINQAGGEVLEVKLNAEGARVENSNDQIPNTKQ